MSAEAVLNAVRDELRAALALDRKFVDIAPAEFVPALAGEFWLGIDEGEVEATGENTEHVREEFGVEIAVWRRISVKPDDRKKQVYAATPGSLTDLERRTIANLHGNEHVREVANLASEQGDEFLTPLLYRGRSRTDFLDAPNASDHNVLPFARRILRFRGMLRVQVRENFA